MIGIVFHFLLEQHMIKEMISFVINMTSVMFYSSKKNVDLLFDESIIESILQSLIFEK